MNVHELTLQNYAAASGCPSVCQPTLYLGTAGSYGNEQINVVLGEGWHGLTVKAVFQPCGVPAVVPNGGGVISVPWEATQSVVAYPNGRIVFEGVTDGRVLISTDIHYVVGSHSDTEGSNSQPPTPSQWEQFVDEVKGDADRAEQAAKDAEASVQTVKDAGAQAVTDIGAAKDSALDAIAKAGEDVAGSITADVQAAKDAAAAAEQSAEDAAAELQKVQQAGQTVTGQITQTGATQVGAVQSAGSTQVGLVNSAGQQQAENIAQAGSQQVQAVQAAGMAAVGTVNDARDDAVEEIETANAHSPQVNPDTGYWQTWDTETGEYVDTTTKAEGPKGDKGDPGATPQLTIGTVTTLDPGEDATVTITGTAEAPVLNFDIPKGEPGEDGSAGLPTPTAADAGKVPMVNEDGTGYVLREVSAGGGDAGQPGTDGEDGGYYTPSLDSAGNLSWQASKPGMPDVPEANIRGPQGPQGEPGADGKDGEQGPAGAPGADGTTPTIGPNGNWYLGEIDTGKPSRGEQGTQGEDGGYYTPSVDSEGNLSWTASKADMPSVPGTNIQGPQGIQGDPGATPQLTIGTVTTLDPGEDATVTITGTAEAPVLNFGIPKGEQGDGSTSGSDLPATTAADSGKVPTVNAAGTGYELTGPYAPLSAAIRPTVSGNPAVCENSVAWGLQGLKVYGMSTQASNQLLPLTEDTYTTGGLTATLQGDGSLVVNGTPQSVPINLVFFTLNLEPGTYYVSGGVPTSGNLYLCVQIASPIGGGFYVNQSFTITGNETSVTAMIQNVDTTSLNDYAISPMINRGNSALPVQKYTGTPSPESPIPITSAGGGGNVDVSMTGKNLLNISKMQQKTTNGITFSLESGGIKINGTATANTDSPTFTFRLPAGTYISNINRAQFPWLNSANYVVVKKDGSMRWLDADVAFTVLDEDIGKYFYFTVAKGKTVNEIIYPQLELGSVSTDYEPYTSQSLTISTPNGLPGIPVTSGGNYTIDGQQYRGNIRDYGAEVDTIAVEQIDSYNGEDVGDVWMSSTGQLTTGAQVVYALDTPTTRAIQAAEIAAYRALHTYDGVTMVSTAEDVAGLEVKYVADAQKYIDNRLTAAEQHIQELAAAQLNAQTGG